MLNSAADISSLSISQNMSEEMSLADASSSLELIGSKKEDSRVNTTKLLDQKKSFWRSKNVICVTILEHVPTSRPQEISHPACIEVIACNFINGEEAPHLYFDSQKVFSNARDHNFIQSASNKELAKSKYGKQLMASFIFDRINMIDTIRDKDHNFEICLRVLLSDQLLGKVSFSSIHINIFEYINTYI